MKDTFFGGEKKIHIFNYSLLWVSFIKGIVGWTINLSLLDHLNENNSWCRRGWKRKFNRDQFMQQQ